MDNPNREHPLDTLDDPTWPHLPDTPPPVVTLTANEGQRLLKALCSGFIDQQLLNRLAEELQDHICHPFEPRQRRDTIIRAAYTEAARDKDLYRRGYAKGYDIGHDIGWDAGKDEGERGGYQAGYHDGQAGHEPRLKPREPQTTTSAFAKAKAKRGLTNVSLFDDTALRAH